MRITYYGQACIHIEVAGKRILTNPWLTEGAYFGTWFHTHLLTDAGVTPETFPKDNDYILPSHEHQDHLNPLTLRHMQVTHGTVFLYTSSSSHGVLPYTDSLLHKTSAPDAPLSSLGSTEITSALDWFLTAPYAGRMLCAG
jgi:hypothetical protein